MYIVLENMITLNKTLEQQKAITVTNISLAAVVAAVKQTCREDGTAARAGRAAAARETQNSPASVSQHHNTSSSQEGKRHSELSVCGSASAGSI